MTLPANARVPCLALLICLHSTPVVSQARALFPTAEGREGFTPGTERRVTTRTSLGDDQVISTRQGAEGFAYEVTHPVLDEYGKLSTATQYHGQDGLGRYRYSYKHPGSTHEEYVDENGRVQGSFSYRSDDEDDISMSYYADDTGFHVKRAVLPPLADRAPRDDPLVAAIKAAHIKLWRETWLKQAAASLGQPIPDDAPELNVPLGIPPVLPPADTAETVVQPSPPEQTSVAGLDSEVISFDDDAAEDAVEEPDPNEPIIPIFPGAPDAPSQPVASAPKPLPSGVGLSSPDDETIVVEAKSYADSDSSASSERNRKPLLGRVRLLDERPVGALRIGGYDAVVTEAELSTSASQNQELRLRPRLRLRPARSGTLRSSGPRGVAEGRTRQRGVARSRPRGFAEERNRQRGIAQGRNRPRGVAEGRTRYGASESRSESSEGPSERPAGTQSDSSSVRGAAVQLRVSEEAARIGRVPVAARHNRAQVRPSQIRGEEGPPLLDDPLLYYYSSLLYEAREAAKRPEIIVV